MVTGNRYDVLIVGARCAGAATAMLMARRGLRVLVIDRSAHGADTLSTHALMRGGVLQLHRWGVLPRLIEMGTPPVRSTTFHYGDEVVEVAIKSQNGVDALYAPRRTVLDAVLVDMAREAGADVRHGHSLAALVRDPAGRVTGARIIDDAGVAFTVEAELVVGADGANSAVARMVGAPVQHEGRHAVVAQYGYWSGIETRGYHWYYRGARGAGAIPTNGGLTCVFSATSRQHEPRADYLDVITSVEPDLARALAGATLQGRLWRFAGRKSFLRKPFGPGWALVGDAGYFKDPLTAHGITDALRDAELLADAAARGTQRAFANYAETRDALSMDLFEVTDAIAAMDWDLDGLKDLHRALNRSMKDEVDYLAALDHGRPVVAQPVAVSA